MVLYIINWEILAASFFEEAQSQKTFAIVDHKITSLKLKITKYFPFKKIFNPAIVQTFLRAEVSHVQ